MINSLYLRLNFTAVLVLAGFLSVTGAVLDKAFIDSSKMAMQEWMMGQLYHLLTVVDVNANGHLSLPLPTQLPNPKLALPGSGLYAFITQSIAPNGQRQLLWRSPSLVDKKIPVLQAVSVGEKHWQEVQLTDGKDYSVLGFGLQRTVKSGVFAFNFYLLAELGSAQKEIRFYRQRLWGGLLLAGLLLLAIQSAVLYWALRPLRKVSSELGVIETGGKQRIDGRYPYEIAQFANKINALLGQERARQSRYRNALADLAHSLKTPLTVLLGKHDNTENLPDLVHEQAMRMMQTVERQLQRAESHNSVSSLPFVSVSELADRLGKSFHKIYQAKAIVLASRIDPEARYRCNEADLIEVFGNLMDNAYKWANSAIVVEGWLEDRTLTLVIHDDGPGIDNDKISQILRRGGRVDESVPGYGIGLNIVAEIVDAHQGKLSFATSDLGGAKVTVELSSG